MRVRWLSIGLVPAVLLVWACATVPPEPSEDLDPNAPEIDAGWKPKRAPGDGPSTPSSPAKPTTTTAPTAPTPAMPVGDASVTPSTKRAVRGDIVITEIMYDPTGSEPEGEWFEVQNRATEARSLAGVTIEDGGGRTHVIADDVVVEPGAFAILARDRAAAGVPSVAYEYGKGLSDSVGILLANGPGGAVKLVDVDAVSYGSFGLGAANGQSAQLEPDGTWKLAAPTPGAAAGQ